MDNLKGRNHIFNSNLNRIENPESAVERHVESPLDEVIIAHIKVLYHLNETRKYDLQLSFQFQNNLFLAREYFEAYKQQSICVQAVVKLLQCVKDENWCLPIMFVTCLD